ncbi:hypothetical protein J6590_054283 [Homalodisca vitripennis]|nr:hypothetical protein J6590_054283 [Homalodisca vitripennis]
MPRSGGVKEAYVQFSSVLTVQSVPSDEQIRVESYKRSKLGRPGKMWIDNVYMEMARRLELLGDVASEMGEATDFILHLNFDFDDRRIVCKKACPHAPMAYARML